jgi:hypothetical protein
MLFGHDLNHLNEVGEQLTQVRTLSCLLYAAQKFLSLTSAAQMAFNVPNVVQSVVSQVAGNVDLPTHQQQFT